MVWFGANVFDCLVPFTQTVQNLSSLENLNELFTQRQQDSLCLQNFGSLSAFALGWRTQSTLTYWLKLTCLSETACIPLYETVVRAARLVLDLHTLTLTATTSLSMTCYYLYFLFISYYCRARNRSQGLAHSKISLAISRASNPFLSIFLWWLYTLLLFLNHSSWLR